MRWVCKENIVVRKQGVYCQSSGIRFREGAEQAKWMLWIVVLQGLFIFISLPYLLGWDWVPGWMQMGRHSVVRGSRTYPYYCLRLRFHLSRSSIYYHSSLVCNIEWFKVGLHAAFVRLHPSFCWGMTMEDLRVDRVGEKARNSFSGEVIVIGSGGGGRGWRMEAMVIHSHVRRWWKRSFGLARAVLIVSAMSSPICLKPR